MSHDRWHFNKPKEFRDQAQALPKSLRPRLTEVMTELSTTPNPNSLGKKKHTKYGVCYTVRLNDSYRLAYISHHATHRIEIIRVGDHKDVYGKD